MCLAISTETRDAFNNHSCARPGKQSSTCCSRTMPNSFGLVQNASIASACDRMHCCKSALS
eukprot:10859907-Lingulodinium_polyedra.AAC.1